ncbi:calcium-binding EF hand family protein [Actinidia rufa]|uniref:Calcium-binding EF hand family protein n=1 Tax=Actinidia rufa TaxID=165716 RepID=A0A7J0D8Q2_9ERIC|nr:calcium-binding EF hand family protein [Actinidia rufa]
MHAYTVLSLNNSTFLCPHSSSPKTPNTYYAFSAENILTIDPPIHCFSAPLPSSDLHPIQQLIVSWAGYGEKGRDGSDLEWLLRSVVGLVGSSLGLCYLSSVSDAKSFLSLADSRESDLEAENKPKFLFGGM